MSDTQLTNIEGVVTDIHRGVAPQIATTMTMLDRAVASGASVEILTKLMDLHERHERNVARRAFDEAMAAVRTDLPPIVKNRAASFGQGKTAYRYEDLASLTEALSPVMAEHGLSFRWRTGTGDKGVTVTCIIAHRGGHSEETSLTAGHDTSGSKNAIQALGSAVTYLQRYTLKAAIGVAAGLDDDNHAPPDVGGPINGDQLTALLALANDVAADVPKFCKYMKIASLADLPASRFNEAKEALEAKRAKP